MQVSYYHSSIIFKTGKASVPQGSEDAEPVAANSSRSRVAGPVSKHAVCVHRKERMQRSRSSPERRSSPQRQRVRTRSPSSATTSVSTEAAVLSPTPLYYHGSNAPGAVAFYSPGPPSRPMNLIFLPPNPVCLPDDAKTFEPMKLQPRTKSKKSRKIVRHVMRALLKGVDKAVTARAQLTESTAPVAPNISTAEDTSQIQPNPVFNSVASQTNPKSPVIRQAAALTVADDLSISSEEYCVDSNETCEWAGNVRALRDSHVRLVLRQLQQLRHIERLNRKLLRTQPPARTVTVSHHASCVSSKPNNGLE